MSTSYRKCNYSVCNNKVTNVGEICETCSYKCLTFTCTNKVEMPAGFCKQCIYDDIQNEKPGKAYKKVYVCSSCYKVFCNTIRQGDTGRCEYCELCLY